MVETDELAIEPDRRVLVAWQTTYAPICRGFGVGGVGAGGGVVLDSGVGVCDISTIQAEKIGRAADGSLHSLHPPRSSKADSPVFLLIFHGSSVALYLSATAPSAENRSAERSASGDRRGNAAERDRELGPARIVDAMVRMVEGGVGVRGAAGGDGFVVHSLSV